MIKIWGRTDSSNVQKVLWCLGELGLDFERIDLGGKFGGNKEKTYLDMNPNGLVPTTNALPGVPFPLAAPDPVGEISHPVKHGVDLRHYVLTVYNDRHPLGRTKRHVKDGTTFRDIDFVATEHRFDSRL